MDILTRHTKRSYYGGSSSPKLQSPMNIDSDNPVVALCSAGMAIEGDSHAALALFEQAWRVRRYDYGACTAEIFVAPHQATPEETLRWNALAVQHAEKVT